MDEFIKSGLLQPAPAPLATIEALNTELAGKQDKLTAGEGITISAENVISATGGSGGGAVTSVNGNTGAVVLTGDNIMTASDSTTSLNSALAGKQASITADTELTCKSVTTSYDSALNSINYAGNISFTGDSGNGSLGKITANELFTNASGYYGTRIQASGITCTSGAGGTTWFNVNSSDNTVSVDGIITAASPTADANNNQVATTSWVKTAIASSGGGGVSDDITCKTLKVTEWDSGLDSIEFAGNLKYSGDYGNGSLGIITAREFYANASGYYSTRVSTSGIILSYGSGGNHWFNADSSTRILTIDGTLKSSTPTADANNTEVATTAWVNTAITSKAASTNADNFSVAGKAVLAGMGMPSSKYLDVTVGANGTTYTAPANGYFFSTGNFNQDNGAVRLLNDSKHSFGTSSHAGKAWYYAVFVPCQKGDKVAFFYQSVGDVKLTFLYAEGDQEG